MLYPDTMQNQYSITSPDDYTKRMVKRRLPNLNIVQILNPNDTKPRPIGLQCGFTVSIWSEAAPDVASNLTELLSEKVLAKNLMLELTYFDAQLPMIRAQDVLRRAEIDFLFSIPRRRKAADPDWRWFDEWSMDRDELRDPRAKFKEVQKLASIFDDAEWGQADISSDDRRLAYTDAVTAADKKRKEIKRLYQQIDMLDDVKACLTCYKSGAARTDLPPKDYVVSAMLSRGSATKRKKVASVLRELGLPVPMEIRSPKWKSQL